MARVQLSERINEGLLLLDGAMGTQLLAAGVKSDGCNDYLNITSADVIGEIHSAYLDAGSDAVLTNTFGANRYSLARHGHDDKVEEINLVGAQIGRKAGLFAALTVQIRSPYVVAFAFLALAMGVQAYLLLRRRPS